MLFNYVYLTSYILYYCILFFQPNHICIINLYRANMNPPDHQMLIEFCMLFFLQFVLIYIDICIYLYTHIYTLALFPYMLFLFNCLYCFFYFNLLDDDFIKEWKTAFRLRFRFQEDKSKSQKERKSGV